MAMDTTSEWSFSGPTAPFFDLAGADPAHFVFEQVGDDRFSVSEGVLYDDGERRVELSPETPLQTDLASIPLFMAWFVPVNGRHTPAALVHDKLVAEAGRAGERGGPGVLSAADHRAEADDLFLDAMAACDVPLLRRRIMHSAVCMATRLARSWPARVAMSVWLAASVLGSVALVLSLSTGRWWVALAAVLAPVLGGVLWGPRNWGPAVLAGYVAWVIVLPALGTAIGYSVYWVAEQVVRLAAARGRGAVVSDVPRPAPYR